MSDEPENEVTEEPTEVEGEREEIEIPGVELVDKVKELIDEGSIRQLVIRNQSGRVLFELPLTAGLVAGGIFALAFPITSAVMAVLGGIAGTVARVKIEIVRAEPGEEGDADSPDTTAKGKKHRIEIDTDDK